MPRNTTITVGLAAAISFVFPVVAHADVNDASEPQATSMRTAHTSFGFRVGGYGFRNTHDPDKGEWEDCKMGGVGVFGQRSLSKFLFAEAAVDIYSAEDLQEQVEAGAVEMDRVSGIASVAAGAKMPVGRFTPYVQTGLGIEVTRVRANGMEDNAVLPMGFVGLGADVRLTDGLYFGMNFRTNVMKHYLHGHDGDDLVPAVGGGEHEHDGHLQSEYDLATQGQFFLRYQM